jgi:hypothetical protein
MTGYDKWTKILDMLAIPDGSIDAANRRSWAIGLGRLDQRAADDVYVDIYRSYTALHGERSWREAPC